MKTMKKFAALMMLLCALMICTIPALAANESGSDSNVTETVSVTAGSNDDMMICTKGEKDEFCEAVLNHAFIS